MHFSKYHGCGNHFIITREAFLPSQDYGVLAKKVCDPNLGIGADGFILVKESPLEMVFFNRDGSVAPMCGNGIRCFAHYCLDEVICNQPSFSVKTGAGDMDVDVTGRKPFSARINMGKPDFSPEVCSIIGEKEPFLHRDLSGHEVNTFFMGTIHTVLWTDDFSHWVSIGEELCHHRIYGEKTNVNFAKITGPNGVQVKTYERGVGPTLACGTGACAVAVLGWEEGIFKGDVTVYLPYGELMISQGENDEIFMEGPSHLVFKGTYLDEGEE